MNMSKSKQIGEIQVLFKLPSEWVKYDDPLFGLGHFLKEKFEDKLEREAVKVAIKDLKIPKLKITKEELKKAVLNKLSEIIIEGGEDWEDRMEKLEGLFK